MSKLEDHEDMGEAEEVPRKNDKKKKRKSEAAQGGQLHCALTA
jgi:hypothetical protein